MQVPSQFSLRLVRDHWARMRLFKQESPYGAAESGGGDPIQVHAITEGRSVFITAIPGKAMNPRSFIAMKEGFHKLAFEVVYPNLQICGFFQCKIQVGSMMEGIGIGYKPGSHIHGWI